MNVTLAMSHYRGYTLMWECSLMALVFIQQINREVL